MASRKQKNQMTQFIADRVEESGLYQILSRNHEHVLISEKPEVRSTPITIDVFVHNHPSTQKDIKDNHNQNYAKNIHTAHVLLKDGKVGFVRLAQNEAWRVDKSLKKYTPQQINQILHLRQREKLINQNFNNLVYYQPQTERLSESLRVFGLDDVWLDYSHIRPGDQGYGFVQNGISKDYKLAVDKGKIEIAKIKLYKGYLKLGQLVQT